MCIIVGDVVIANADNNGRQYMREWERHFPSSIDLMVVSRHLGDAVK